MRGRSRRHKGVKKQSRKTEKSAPLPSSTPSNIPGGPSTVSPMDFIGQEGIFLTDDLLQKITAVQTQRENIIQRTGAELKAIEEKIAARKELEKTYANLQQLKSADESGKLSKNEAIKNIQKGVQFIAEAHSVIHQAIQNQGEMVNVLAENTENAQHHVEQAEPQLQKADSSKSFNRKLKAGGTVALLILATPFVPLKVLGLLCFLGLVYIANSIFSATPGKESNQAVNQNLSSSTTTLHQKGLSNSPVIKPFLFSGFITLFGSYAQSQKMKKDMEAFSKALSTDASSLHFTAQNHLYEGHERVQQQPSNGSELSSQPYKAKHHHKMRRFGH